jgi:hypothetical protein
LYLIGIPFYQKASPEGHIAGKKHLATSNGGQQEAPGTAGTHQFACELCQLSNLTVWSLVPARRVLLISSHVLFSQQASLDRHLTGKKHVAMTKPADVRNPPRHTGAATELAVGQTSETVAAVKAVDQFACDLCQLSNMTVRSLVLVS